MGGIAMMDIIELLKFNIIANPSAAMKKLKTSCQSLHDV